MNERIQGTGQYTRIRKGNAGERDVEICEVLSEDMRTVEFSGPLDACLRYLQSQCPTGKCEN